RGARRRSRRRRAPARARRHATPRCDATDAHVGRADARVLRRPARAAAPGVRDAAGALVKYRIVHKTEYVYDEPVTSCHNEAHVPPRALPRRRVTSHAIDVEPKPATMSRRKDWFGTPVLYFAVQSAHPILSVTARSFVERDDDDCRRYQRSTATWNDV